MFIGKEHSPQSSDPVRRTAASSPPAHIFARFDQEREDASFVLSSLRTLFLVPTLQPSHYQTVAHSFTYAEKFNRRVSNHFHALSALFCQRAKTNSLVFTHRRTILWKWGVWSKERAKVTGPCRRFRAEVRSGAKVPGLCRPRQEAPRAGWSSFRGKQVKESFGGKKGQEALRAICRRIPRPPFPIRFFGLTALPLHPARLDLTSHPPTIKSLRRFLRRKDHRAKSLGNSHPWV